MILRNMVIHGQVSCDAVDWPFLTPLSAAMMLNRRRFRMLSSKQINDRRIKLAHAEEIFEGCESRQLRPYVLQFLPHEHAELKGSKHRCVGDLRATMV